MGFSVRKGYTLTEILVAFTVLSILSLMGVNSFNRYQNHAKLAVAITVLEALNNEAMERFNQGVLGSSFEYGDNVLTNTISAYDHYPVISATYFPPLDVGAGNGNEEWMFCVQVAGLRFDNYVEPASAGASGTYSQLCHKVARQGTHFTHYCGNYDGSSSDIPINQLTTGCECNSVSSKNC